MSLFVGRRCRFYPLSDQLPRECFDLSIYFQALILCHLQEYDHKYI